MIMMKTRFYRKHGERGQVLILALIALLILTLAIFLLLDISNVIRAKVKSQNAVDAAALTGANWQRHTLNLIGELNLVKAQYDGNQNSMEALTKKGEILNKILEQQKQSQLEAMEVSARPLLLQ